MLLYHGTAFVFERFDTPPMCFTADFEAAVAYARSCSVRENEDYQMVVLAVEVDESCLEEISNARFLEEFGDEGSHNGDSWEAALNYALEVEEEDGKLGVMIRDCLDYGGRDCETDERFDRRYDQAIIASPDKLTIVERIVIPDNFKIYKDTRYMRTAEAIAAQQA